MESCELHKVLKATCELLANSPVKAFLCGSDLRTISKGRRQQNSKSTSEKTMSWKLRGVLLKEAMSNSHRLAGIQRFGTRLEVKRI